METAVKTMSRKKAADTTDVRLRIKPRGIVGSLKDKITLYGTSEDVFSLNRLAVGK